METVAVDVRVSGRVQGVSYRMHCQDEARRLGVTGWVRNEPDGTVAGHFEGTCEQVDELVAWCRSGSPWAKVDSVEVEDTEPTGAAGFEAG